MSYYNGNISRIKYYKNRIRGLITLARKLLHKEHAGYLSLGNEKTNVEKEFKTFYNSSIISGQSFSDIMRKVLEHNEIDAETFDTATKLHENFYSVLKSRGKEICDFRTVITICVGLNLNIDITKKLLKSVGCAFSPTIKLNQAYKFLIEKYQSKDIEACNEILKQLGFGDEKYLLGSRSYNK